MMLRDLVCIVFLLAGCSSEGVAADNCPITLMGSELHQSSCEEAGGVLMAVFSSSAESPYATDLDVRKVVVARSSDAARLAGIFGFTGFPRQPTYQGMRLLEIPHQDQVETVALEKPYQVDGWQIGQQIIQFSEQGNAPGFSMVCATAFSAERMLATAECFPMEEQERFVRTLADISVKNGLKKPL